VSYLIPITAGIGKNKSNNKRRITMIKKNKKSKWASTVSTLLLIISIGVIGLTGCNLIAKYDANPDTEETKNSTDGTNSEDTTEDTVTQIPTESEQETTVLQILGYIRSIDTVNKTITLDQVELLYSTDEERLTELGMTSDDLITGYYVYNDVEELEIISYDDTTSIELLDIEKAELSTSSVDEFKARLNNNQVLCNLSIKDNKVVNINEQYLP
jgi:hypothetical protein